MPSTMTYVSDKMATTQQPESCRVRNTSGPRRHSKGHVVTFSKSGQVSKGNSSSKSPHYSLNSYSEDERNDSPDPPTRQNFDVLKTLHEGKFSKILLVKLDGCKERMVLKAVDHKSASSVHMFYREMDYNYLLSPHENVVTSYNVVLRWENYYIFAQEYGTGGDLGRYLKKFGALSEQKTKTVARQLSSALDFIHGLNLVHQAVIPENILVFNRECTLIKLSDFCGMRPSGTLVMKGNLENYCYDDDDDGQQISSLLAYTPPEVCCKLPQEKYHVHPSIDVWSVGIIIWACLSGTGQGPWQSADVLRDPSFRQFYEWAKKKSLKVPDAFQPLSCRLLRLIKRLLEPKPEKRCKAREVLKYIKDDWLSPLAGKNTAAVLTRLGMSRSESCTLGVSGTYTGAWNRANSQKYARRASTCPRPKSEYRRKNNKTQESNNNSGNNSSANNSPRTSCKITQSKASSSVQDGFRISCVLETTRAILSNMKSSAATVVGPPSPTPPPPSSSSSSTSPQSP